MGSLMGSYRLASKAAGDDVTLTRMVRDTGGVRSHRTHKPYLPGFEAPYIQAGRTRYGKRVKRVSEMRNILVSGHDNVKIGRDVRKGKFRGKWIYTLSLEERKTCPSSCQHWQTCYGNNMPFAKRVDHRSANFLPRLEKEIKRLSEMPGRKGLLIRLHALGDFYSTDYVEFWMRMLRTYPRLAIYGYTAHIPNDGTGIMNIGDYVDEMNHRFPGRCFVRFSNGGLEKMSTVTIKDETSQRGDAFICPEQTVDKKQFCCATCGACWGTTKNVAFMEH